MGDGPDSKRGFVTPFRVALIRLFSFCCFVWSGSVFGWVEDLVSAKPCQFDASFSRLGSGSYVWGPDWCRCLSFSWDSDLVSVWLSFGGDDALAWKVR